ncbi:M81 family metallopeptidase [Lichenihabitans sp. Uapishka_5]|uniref:M81 family metallopeptidase n=1 Tax=Lichenihabitans sp. Uapishka_5 TaxID=3037302 RepID=UPI0029E7E17B|nr:M81 family metallopeptidase [Lichenihabitans sp. Uapishka_5]MDX7949678.1 M81 family metallopeptidase [Lichenihabitans sp. Uapishka_5]
MSPRYRVALGGLHTECSTASPVVMTEGDFRVLRGPEMFATEALGSLAAPDVALLPTFYARAVPGGPVSRATYEAFKAEFLDRLRATLPLDGLFLATHGAVTVEGLDDAEADWIGAARACVGPACWMAASYDLHGNLSQTIVDGLDILAAYRTAPHIDVRDTALRAWVLLLATLRDAIRPGLAWAPIPVLLPGERTSTEDEPARGLYGGLAELDRLPGVCDANLLVGYVWADQPRATAAALVTGTDPTEASRIAAGIAQGYWDARRAFRFGPKTGSLDAMLDIAAAATTHPVILADSGDNPTGGGVGDRADVLAALMARRQHGALLAGIVDRSAVAACIAAGTGARLRLTIGASLDPAGIQVSGEADVLRLDLADRQAVVRLADHDITVVLSSRRRPYHNMSDFQALGLDPAAVRLLVVKSGYLSPELAPLANPNLMALTEGVVNQDIPRLANRRRLRPTFPFQDGFAYAPEPRLSKRWADRIKAR